MCGSVVRHSMIFGAKYVTFFSQGYKGGPEIRCLRLFDVVAICNRCVRRLPKGPAQEGQVEGQSGIGIAR